MRQKGNHGEPVTANLFKRKPSPDTPTATTTSPQPTTSTTSPQIDMSGVGDKAERGEPAQRGDFVAYSGSQTIYFGDVTTVKGDLEKAAQGKRNLYFTRYLIPHNVFVPFVVGTMGDFGIDAKKFLEKILRASDPKDHEAQTTAHRHTARIQIAFHSGNDYMSNTLYQRECAKGDARARGEGGEMGGVESQ